LRLRQRATRTESIASASAGPEFIGQLVPSHGIRRRLQEGNRESYVDRPHIYAILACALRYRSACATKVRCRCRLRLKSRCHQLRQLSPPPRKVSRLPPQLESQFLVRRKELESLISRSAIFAAPCLRRNTLSDEEKSSPDPARAALHAAAGTQANEFQEDLTTPKAT